MPTPDNPHESSFPRLVAVEAGWEHTDWWLPTDTLGLFAVPADLNLDVLAAHVHDRRTPDEFLALLADAGAHHVTPERFHLAYAKSSTAAEPSLSTHDRSRSPLTIDYRITCCACPTQAEGTVNDWPFYFRYRWGHWSFRMPALPDGNPVLVDDRAVAAGGFYREGDAGNGPLDGEMDEDCVDHVIAHCAREWAAEQPSTAVEQHERLRRALADPTTWTPRPRPFVQVGRVLHHFLRLPTGA